MAQKHNLTIQAVSIIGGILTAIFFLGFLALARIIRSEISCQSLICKSSYTDKKKPQCYIFSSATQIRILLN